MADVGSDLSLRKRVGIIGSNMPNAQSLRNAERMGELIALGGYILVNGGMRGVMEASARSCKDAGGFVIAITPGKSRDEGNPFSDVVIPTGLGHMRNGIVVLNSDIVVAIDGSYGTLSEIAYCKIYERIVFGLNTWKIEGVISMPTPEAVMEKINDYFKKING
ncbi:MAG TPA: TIGR00725 family protein [Candidatus Deferrimicrobium sp.]|nr:TIGR00725 family protein [Candidatus Deferrimicrobium sp.]